MIGKNLLFRLTAANKFTDTNDERRQVQFLSFYLILSALFGLLTLIIFNWLAGISFWAAFNFQLMLGVTIMQGFFYFLNRTRYHKIAAYLTIGLTTIALMIFSLTEIEPYRVHTLYFLIIPVALGIVYFPIKLAYFFNAVIGVFIFSISRLSIAENGLPNFAPIIFYLLSLGGIYLALNFVKLNQFYWRQELLRRFEQLQVFYQLADIVNNANALEIIYEAALIGLQKTLTVDRAAILLFDSDGVLRFKKSVGLSESYQTAVSGHCPWQIGDRNPKPILIHDAKRGELGELEETVLTEGIRALAFIPLVTQGKLLGKFMLYYDEPHQFDSGEVQLAQTIARHVALGLNRKLSEDALTEKADALKRSNDLISLLHQVALQINSAHDLDEVLKIFGAELKQRGIYYWFSLIDEETQTLQSQYISLDERMLSEVEAATGINIQTLSASLEHLKGLDFEQAGKLTFTDDPNKLVANIFDKPVETIKKMRLVLNQEQPSKIKFIPLSVDGRPIGLLGFGGQGLVQVDMAALSVFASQLAVTIHRSRLFGALEASEEQYRIVSELVSDWAYAYRVEEDGRFIREWTTNAFVRATGYAENELIDNDTWVAIIHPSDQETYLARQADLLAGYANTTDYRIVTKAQEVRWLRDYSQPVVNQTTQRVERILGAMQDITELREAQEQLFRQQKMESLGLMASGIAHDFNNLLVAIMGQMSVASVKLPANSPAVPHMEKANKATERAAELTQQMLAFAGGDATPKKLVDLKNQLLQKKDLLIAMLPKKVVMTLDFPPELPPVRANASQIQQVFMNLIINSAEAIGDGPGVIHVSLNVVHEKQLPTTDCLFLTEKKFAYSDYVRLRIADNGCGMSEEELPNIFDPFFTTKFTGRGLGLAAVLGIVQAHQGVIAVDSQVGQGSVFEIFLPLSGEVIAERRRG